MLYGYIGDGEKTELRYHGEEEEEENWKLRGGVKEQYETIMQKMEEELQLACVSYHKLHTRLLHYETYCAFMET